LYIFWFKNGVQASDQFNLSKHTNVWATNKPQKYYETYLGLIFSDTLNLCEDVKGGHW